MGAPLRDAGPPARETGQLSPLSTSTGQGPKGAPHVWLRTRLRQILLQAVDDGFRSEPDTILFWNTSLQDACVEKPRGVVLRGERAGGESACARLLSWAARQRFSTSWHQRIRISARTGNNRKTEEKIRKSWRQGFELRYRGPEAVQKAIGDLGRSRFCSGNREWRLGRLRLEASVVRGVTAARGPMRHHPRAHRPRRPIRGCSRPESSA